MNLSREAFNLLFDALQDGFGDYDELALLSRQCHRPLQDITERTARPTAIQALIDDCASRDGLEGFITCLQQRYPHNRLVAALRFADLAVAPSHEEVVETGGGGQTFKDRLKATLSQLDVPGMHHVVADELTQLLDGASDQEARTLYLATLGQVKVDRADAVVRAMVPAMAAALRRRIGDGKRSDDVELDLDRTRLRHIDLGGLDLHQADLAFADLRYANLDDANLWRSRGYAVDVSHVGLTKANLEEVRWHFAIGQRAQLHDCRMISAFFKDADLKGAELYRSRCQGAHFERADLTGARFEQANVADAYFIGATIDDAAAASLARAVKWEAAHFDPAARAAIEAHR